MDCSVHFTQINMTETPPPDSKFNDDMIRQTIFAGIRKASLWMTGIIVLLGLLSYNLQRGVEYFVREYQVLLYCFSDGDSWWVPCGFGIAMAESTSQHTGTLAHFLGRVCPAGLLINYALPGPMGEIMGGWLLKREDNTPIVAGLTASTLARLIGLFTAVSGSVLLWWWISIEALFCQNRASNIDLGYRMRRRTIDCPQYPCRKLSNSTSSQDKDEYHPLKLIGELICSKFGHCHLDN